MVKQSNTSRPQNKKNEINEKKIFFSKSKPPFFDHLVVPG